MRGRNLLTNKVLVTTVCVLMALAGVFLLYKGLSAKKPAAAPAVIVEQTIPTVMPATTPTPLPRLRSLDALEDDVSQAIQPIEGIPQGVKVTGETVASAEAKQAKPSLPRRAVSFLWKILTSWPAIFVYVLLIIFWRGGLLRHLRQLRRSGSSGQRTGRYPRHLC